MDSLFVELPDGTVVNLLQVSEVVVENWSDDPAVVVRTASTAAHRFSDETHKRLILDFFRSRATKIAEERPPQPPPDEDDAARIGGILGDAFGGG